MRPDLVIRNGTVYDGTGCAPIRADVAIAGDRILEVGAIDIKGIDELDATGAVVAPGFIDIHSHSDFTLLVDPRAMSAIHQGVTCEVIGNCGFGCFPIGEPALASGNIYGFTSAVPMTWSTAAGYLARLDEARPAVNVLTLVPNGQLRLSAMGMSDAPADPIALGRMVRALEGALDEGAWGLSTGLEYPAESAASAAEIETLCRCIARRGGLYATHTRDRDAGAVAAVNEALGSAERTGVRLQISHLLPRSGREAGERCIEIVEAARERGQDVAFDMHTRLFGTTYLAAALPPWVTAGEPREIASRLVDRNARERMKAYRSILSAGDDWSRVVLLDTPRWPGYGRRDIAAIARERRQEPLDAICDLLAGVADDLTALMVVIHAYSPGQQHEVFAHPMCMPASDATTLAPEGSLASSAFHGSYTWAAWFYRTMVNETGRLTPQAAIHKLTGQPAGILGIPSRGHLARGAYADVTVFDPDSFAERGTTFDPNRLAIGMRHVLVNGCVTLRNGEMTGERKGHVLRCEN